MKLTPEQHHRMTLLLKSVPFRRLLGTVVVMDDTQLEMLERSEAGETLEDQDFTYKHLMTGDQYDEYQSLHAYFEELLGVSE